MIMENDENVITEASAAPRLSWKVLIGVLLSAMAITSSYVVMGSRISELSERVRQIEIGGTVGLRNHVDTTRDEISDLRIQLTEIRKDVQYLREMVEWKLDLRQSLRPPPMATKRAPAAPQPQQDNADSTPK